MCSLYPNPVHSLLLLCGPLVLTKEKVMEVKVIHGIPRESGNKIRNQGTKIYK